MHKPHTPFSVGAALAGVALLTLASGPVSAADKVTFAWPGNMSSGYAPLTFAKALGYFEAEEIELDTVVLKGAGTIVPQIMNGSITTGFITLNPLIVARQPGGPDFGMRYAYNMVGESIWEIVVPADSPIQSLGDLAGKSIGVGGLSFGNVPLTRALLQNQGVDPNSVELVPVGLGAPAFEALRTGKVDALNLYEIMNVMLEQQGTKIQRLELPAAFDGVSSYGLPFSDRMLEENPDVVARFGRALAKGTVACHASTEGCLRSYWADLPEQKPVDLTPEVMAEELAILEARLGNMITTAEKTDLGAFDDHDWKTTINALLEGEQIKNGNIDLTTLYTNAFVEDFNNFDRAKVIEAAKAYGKGGN